MFVEKPVSSPIFAATATSTMTLQTAIDAVGTWTDLSPVRQRGLTSGLFSVARIAGVPPDLLEFTPAALRERVLLKPAAASRIKKSTQQNIFSHLCYAGRRLGLIDEVMTSMSAAWTANLAHLPQRQRLDLTAFARFCSREGIEPGAVDAAALAAFEQHLEHRTLKATSKKLPASACRAWNKAASDVEGWVGTPLPKRLRKHSYILPETDFPVSFRDDLARFEVGYAGDPFDETWSGPESDAAERAFSDGGRARLPRKVTVDLRLAHCRWAGSVLVHLGVPMDEIRLLSDLVVPINRAKEILRFLHTESGEKPSAAGMHVAEVLRIIAKYHVRLPPADVAKIKAWTKPVKLSYKEITPKNRRAMADIMEPATLSKLLELPDSLMRRANELLPTKPKAAASVAFQATAIDFLLRHPVRLKNLLELRVDRHLYRPDPRGSRIVAIEVPGTETKGGAAIRMPVSAAVSATLNTWIKVFRPIIGSPGSPYVFPGHGSSEKPVTHQAARDAIKGATGDFVGVTLNPHRFRHLAAHLYLMEHPGDFETVRLLLGHKSLAATIRLYAGCQIDPAVLSLDALITRKRDSLRDLRRPVRRGTRAR